MPHRLPFRTYYIMNIARDTRLRLSWIDDPYLTVSGCANSVSI
jgi:hypothetical protein